MHPTRDTKILMYLQSGRRAGDAGRWAASSGNENSMIGEPDTHERTSLRPMSQAWFSFLVIGACRGLREARAPRSLRLASPSNKRMHPTADTRVVILGSRLGRRVMRGVGFLHVGSSRAMKKRIILWVITILSFLASAYSVLGLLMVASFSATPNYPAERAQFNANLWGSCTIGFFSIGVIGSIMLWRGRRKPAL